MSRLLTKSLLLVPLIGALAALSSRPSPPASGGHLPPLLPRKEVVRILGAGHIQLVADYFWIQTLQATGRARTAEEYRDIFDYADMVTDLDPQFRELYVFAAAAIPVQAERGKWLNTAESTRILEKGYREVPDHLLLRILLAYNLSAYENQPIRAAQILSETARMPGAPKYLGALATRMFAHAGEFDSGLALAESLYEEAPDEETRATFETRLKELHLERLLTQVERAAAAYQAREGRAAADVAALVQAGDLPAMPVDPFDGEVLIGGDGQARSTAQEKRLRLHSAQGEGPP